MQFTINLLKEDYAYLSIFHTLKRSAFKNTLIFAFLFLVINLSAWVEWAEIFNIYNVIGSIIVFVIFIAIFNALLYLVIKYKVWALLKRSPEQIWKKEITMNKDSIRIKAEFDEWTIQWKSFIEFIETESYFFLFNTTVSGIIIPKRELDWLIEEIREFLTEKSWELHIKYKTK